MRYLLILFLTFSVYKSTASEPRVQLVYDFSDSLWTNETNLFSVVMPSIDLDQVMIDVEGGKLLTKQPIADTMWYFQILPSDSLCCIHVKTAIETYYDRCHPVGKYERIQGKLGGLNKGKISLETLKTLSGIYATKKDPVSPELFKVLGYVLNVVRDHDIIFESSCKGFGFEESVKSYLAKLLSGDILQIMNIQVELQTKLLYAEPIHIEIN